MLFKVTQASGIGALRSNIAVQGTLRDKASRSAPDLER